MDTIFFYLSKIIWTIIAPDSILFILLVLSFIFLLKKNYRKAKLLLALLVTILSLLIFLPVGQWLLHPLENYFPVNPVLPEKVDGIILLGGAEEAVLSNIWQQNEINSSGERLLTFMALCRKYPSAKKIFTGGTGSLKYPNFKGATIAKKIFIEQSLDISSIIFENLSRNTYENAIYSKKLVKPLGTQNWLLITSAWHMPRSVGIFRNIGWPVIPFPVDHRTNPSALFNLKYDLTAELVDTKIAIKEWLGLLAYYLTGKTSRFLPDH